MNLIKSNIPNFLTCLNLLSGCVAVICTLSPQSCGASLLSWQAAGIAIACAAVFDFSDGFMARMLGAYSDLGKQLDSLSDLVSFGVAPGVLMFSLLKTHSYSTWLPWIALLIPVCAAIRLARFNIDTRQTSSFIGMPVPANAIFWIGYAALINAGPSLLTNPAMAAAVVIIISWLMVSPIPMFSLKFKTYGWKNNETRWIFICAAVILLVCFGIPALSIIILTYIFLSLISRLLPRR